MAINFPARETSAGPLDVTKAAGSDDGEPNIHQGSYGNEPLDARTARNADDVTTEPLNERELMERKNPLGYSVTDATEDEIDETMDTDKAASARR